MITKEVIKTVFDSWNKVAAEVIKDGHVPSDFSEDELIDMIFEEVEKWKV